MGGSAAPENPTPITLEDMSDQGGVGSTKAEATLTHPSARDMFPAVTVIGSGAPGRCVLGGGALSYVPETASERRPLKLTLQPPLLKLQPVLPQRAGSGRRDTKNNG